MKTTIALPLILMLIRGTSSLVIRDVEGVESEDPYADYDVFVPQWEVEVTPGGEVQVFNGTIEEIHDQLLQLNSNWDAEFLGSEAGEVKSEGTTFAEDEVEGEASGGLAKRTDFSGSRYGCFPEKYGLTYSHVIRQGITYLRGVKGKPKENGAPDSCGRVSCSYNSAIWWCNDSKKPKTLGSFGSIADGAAYLVNAPKPGSRGRCTRAGGLFMDQYAAGWVGHKTDWSVLVKSAKC